MRLSKAGYYADFVVYPLLLSALATVLMLRNTWQQHLAWVCACLIGVAVSTLMEYAAHRWFLHRIAPFQRMHGMHHAAPNAFVGTPTWASATIAAGLLSLLWWQTGLNFSSGATFGLILGYLWYVSVHHAIHHRRVRDGSYLHRAKVRHGRHHSAREPCNFGVTSGFWDRVFATAWRK